MWKQLAWFTLIVSIDCPNQQGRENSEDDTKSLYAMKSVSPKDPRSFVHLDTIQYNNIHTTVIH